MLDEYSSKLNNLLVNTYRSVLKVEELMIKSVNSIDLSISELHMVECIGQQKQEGKTISDIAQELDITLPSVTVAVKKLTKKGYVRKEKSSEDGRVVRVVLTKLGKRADALHRYFHEQMIRNVMKAIPEEEKDTLVSAMAGLDNFFQKTLDDMKKKQQ